MQTARETSDRVINLFRMKISKQRVILTMIVNSMQTKTMTRMVEAIKVETTNSIAVGSNITKKKMETTVGEATVTSGATAIKGMAASTMAAHVVHAEIITVVPMTEATAIIEATVVEETIMEGALLSMRNSTKMTLIQTRTIGCTISGTQSFSVRPSNLRKRHSTSKFTCSAQEIVRLQRKANMIAAKTARSSCSIWRLLTPRRLT